MSHNTRKRTRRKRNRGETSRYFQRVNHLTDLISHWFAPSKKALVTVKAIDIWNDLRDSLYSVPGRPFKGKRSLVSRKFTVVLDKPLPIIHVKKLIEDTLISEVLHVIKNKGENVDK